MYLLRQKEIKSEIIIYSSRDNAAAWLVFLNVTKTQPFLLSFEMSKRAYIREQLKTFIIIPVGILTLSFPTLCTYLLCN